MNRKGITPIIAIVLLLMMTVAAAGLAWTFIQNTMEEQQTGIKGELSKIGHRTLQIVQIHSELATPTTWNVTIRNPGDPLTLDWDNTIVKVDGRIHILNGNGITGYQDVVRTGDVFTITITNMPNWPLIAQPSKRIEIEMNQDYKFTYTCTPYPDNEQYC
jgi:flagellin-like protein